MSKPDLLIFMSDQHSPVFSSFEGGMARTPNMEKLCEEGTSFTAAYTSCPLCVPARISMLLGKTPTKTGVFTNDGAIPESAATFLHSLVAAGYETVLIGRMHFIGTNQRHGFTKRLVGDMTPVTWNRPSEKLAEERGVFKSGYAEPGCVEVAGGGDSPVLEYDKEVIKTAVDYLSEEHEKPQCIFVSTYGPHFPYVAPEELYLYYKDKVRIPDTFSNLPDYMNPVLSGKVMNVPEETVIRARAAYFGMIETIDAQMGRIRDAFNSFTGRNGRKCVFTYLSDHGDQCGDRRLFGKTTFFETSARIPFIMEGCSIKSGNKVATPAGIMDLGPTLCELAGTKPPPGQEGRSLVPELSGCGDDKDRYVLSELINTVYPKASGAREELCKAFASGKAAEIAGQAVISRMVRKGSFKFITYIGYEEYDLLFDLSCDPEEKLNTADQHPEIVREMKNIALQGWDYEAVLQNQKDHEENVRLVKAWEKAVGPDDSERWNRNPEYARIMPKVT